MIRPTKTTELMIMNDFNIAAKSQDERDKVNIGLATSGVAYKERLNMPVIAEVLAVRRLRSIHRSIHQPSSIASSARSL